MPYNSDMELYHALNRGVDKRVIFLDDQDRSRFVSGLDLLNDRQPVDNLRLIINGTYIRPTRSKSDKLVDVHGWCLMGNHYHLLVSEIADGGLKKFLMKLNVGYAKYFNERYKRSGTLFQGRTKKVRVETDAHFLHILNYIHLNPLDFMRGSQDWRERKITSTSEALKYLKEYKWSSYLDYCGQHNFPDLLNVKFFKEVFADYPKTLRRYLESLEMDEIKPLTLE